MSFLEVYSRRWTWRFHLPLSKNFQKRLVLKCESGQRNSSCFPGRLKILKPSLPAFQNEEGLRSNKEADKLAVTSVNLSWMPYAKSLTILAVGITSPIEAALFSSLT